MKIRKAGLADIKEIAKIISERYKQKNIESIKWLKSYLEDQKRKLVLIAEDKMPIGILIAEIWKDKKNSTIIELSIDKRYRNQGIATQLKEKYEKYCLQNEIKKIISIVATSNNKIQRLNEKLGYKKMEKEFYIYQKTL